MSTCHRVALVTAGPVFALVIGHDRVSGTHSHVPIEVTVTLVSTLTETARALRSRGCGQSFGWRLRR